MENGGVIDLHSDLLAYLGRKEDRTDVDALSRSSILQMKEGKVSLQVLPIYVPTEKGSVELAQKEIHAFRHLCFSKWKRGKPYFEGLSGCVHTLLAIENASALIEEEESLDLAFFRLQALIAEFSPLVYISLTWNGENRFGGGSGSSHGLKRDGEALLEFLSGKKIAIDLSHSSDALARDILTFIDKKGLNLPVIASHSNFRKIQNFQRNLPQEFAEEIIRRKGLIGLNLVQDFIGDPYEEKILAHIEEGLSLKGEKSLALGVDFFCVEDSSTPHTKPHFHSNYADASCLPKLVHLIEKRFGEEMAKMIAHKNFISYFKRWHLY